MEYVANEEALDLACGPGSVHINFGRGSFVSSMAASCVPMRSWILHRQERQLGSRLRGPATWHPTDVGQAARGSTVLMLNGSVDRETSPFICSRAGEAHASDAIIGALLDDFLGGTVALDGVVVLCDSPFDSCAQKEGIPRYRIAGARPGEYDDAALIETLLQVR